MKGLAGILTFDLASKDLQVKGSLRVFIPNDQTLGKVNSVAVENESSKMLFSVSLSIDFCFAQDLG